MPEGPVVCDSGPLIGLSMIDALGVLPQLFREILVPRAVLAEVVGAGEGRIGEREVREARWLREVEVVPAPDPLLASELGSGEAEAITLAYRLDAALVLLDERRARRIAEEAYRLPVRGSAGLLVLAKRAGLVRAVGPLLSSMSSQGYYLAPRLIERACREAGE